MRPIGTVHHQTREVPRHWSISSVEGRLEIDPRFARGLKDIEAGQRIVVLFEFHKSPPFEDSLLVQTPPHHNAPMGVFSICSPVRPNPIGLSVLEVLEVRGATLLVRGLDMFDETPILDLKPHIEVPGDPEDAK